MKKILFFLVLAALFPVLAGATTLAIGDEGYFLKGSMVVSDDLYVLSPASVFAGKIEGDALVISGDIFSQSTIEHDALFFGQRVMVQGNVRDDARLVGGQVEVGGGVGDDAIVFGSDVIFHPSSKVGGTLYAMAGTATLRGVMAGDVRVLAHETRISGTIGGDLEVWGRVEIEEGALIGGDVITHGTEPARVASTAKIGGEVVFDRVTQSSFSLAFLPLSSGFFSLQILMALALGFFLYFLVRERVEEVLLDALLHFWPRVLRGLLIAVIVPAALLLLSVSVVGLPIAIILLSLFVTALIIGMVCAGMLMGLWVERVLFKRSPFPLQVRSVLIGIILFSLFSILPYVGPIFNLIVLFAAIGSIGTVFYGRLKER